MRAHGCKKLGVRKREVQRAIAAHGDAPDSTECTTRTCTIALFDIWEKLLQEELLITSAPVARINVESCASGRGHDQKIADALLLAQVIGNTHAAGTKQHLLVVTQSVKEIER